MVKMPDSIDVQGGPISLVFSKKGRAFFSERITGNIWEALDDGKYNLIKHLPVVQATGHHEAGVLGLALDPDFDTNGLIYTYYTEGEDLDHANNKVIRFEVNSGKETVLIPKIPGGRIHNGGIMAFSPDDKKLYIGVGVDNSLKEMSQDKEYLGGKILRINPDGTIPEDNPTQGSLIHSFGYRNIFGLAFKPRTGQIYVCDVGPERDDEINIAVPDGNYGWPKVVGYTHDPRYVGPIYTYTPVITPTQCVFYDDSLYFGSYNEGSVHKLTISPDGARVVADDIVYQGKPFGVVGVFMNPNNEFFVATTNKILKVKLRKGGQSMKNNLVIWIVTILAVLVIGAGAWYMMYGNQSTINNNNTNQNSSTGTVNISNSTFSPGVITIKKGDTVTWKNNESLIHRIVADDGSFDLGDMANGATVKRTFDTAGSFTYYCSLHPDMTGTVVVQ
jgi:glucose/arabinose dehydrogenase/plastocyanin